MNDDDFRGSGNVVPPITENIAEDWEAMQYIDKKISKFVYRLYFEHDFERLEFWKLRCVGDRKDKSIFDKDIPNAIFDKWLYRHAEAIWRGPEARELPPEFYGGNGRWKNKEEDRAKVGVMMFAIRKTDVYVDFGTALAQFEYLWTCYQQSKNDELEGIEASIKKLESDREKVAAQVRILEQGFPLAHLRSVDDVMMMI